MSRIAHSSPTVKSPQRRATSGPLSNAYDLHIAAAAALKPLIELGERAEEFFARRDAAKGRS
jgi:hypothetical protein